MVWIEIASFGRGRPPNVGPVKLMETRLSLGLIDIFD